ncbi:MAG: aquaporin, partial [Planctomycetota bacterium]
DNGSPLGPVAIGMALTALVYMGGHVSGAHYNPVVSAAFVLRGNFSSRQLVPYWISQLSGALLASAAVWGLTGQLFQLAPAEGVSVAAAVGAEVAFTFALVAVILSVATCKATHGNQFYGVAIGGIVMGAAFAAGPISGAALNPAVGCGPIVFAALLGDANLNGCWLYLLGPLVGAIAATALFRVIAPYSRP